MVCVLSIKIVIFYNTSCDIIITYHFRDKNTLAKKFVNNESEVDKDDTLQNMNEKTDSITGPSNHVPIVEDMNEYELNNSDDDISMYRFTMIFYLSGET